MAKRFDLSNWGILFAVCETQHVGGAAVAWRSPEIEMLDGRDDLACLWDLRVHPDHRNKGVGQTLLSYAADWARQRHCRRLKVETQNVNVPACRFYARQGFELGSVNKHAYGAELDEVQLLWYLDL
ncbi:MAG: GNAT family N-acetyltransferase [Blastocatellia bacterium]|nr:GNAT family N-acetyltransferase [Blastocatellia bacterium]